MSTSTVNFGYENIKEVIVCEFEKSSGVTVVKNWGSGVADVVASTNENGACRRTSMFSMWGFRRKMDSKYPMMLLVKLSRREPVQLILAHVQIPMRELESQVCCDCCTKELSDQLLPAKFSRQCAARFSKFKISEWKSTMEIMRVFRHGFQSSVSSSFVNSTSGALGSGFPSARFHFFG